MHNFPSALHAIPFFQQTLAVFKPQQQLSNTVLWAYQTAAEQLGVNHKKDALGHHFFLGSTHIGSMQRTKTDLNSKQAIRICNDKALTKRYLLNAGVSVAVDQLITVAEQQQALSFAVKYGFQIVVKPLDARAGEGITSDLANADQLAAAIAHAAQSNRRATQVLLEQKLTGFDLRFIIVDGKFVCAASRIPAHVTGDGQHSLIQLLQRKNQERRKNPHHKRYLLAESLIAARGLNPQETPANGEILLLAGPANVHLGGETFDVTDLIGDELKALAIQAAASIPGLKFAGVDIFSTSLTDPKHAAVLEINTQPNIGIHAFPIRGKSRNVAYHVIQCWLANAALKNS